MRRKSIGATSQAFHEPMSTGAFLEFLTRFGLKCWSEDGNPASHDTVKLRLGKPSNAPQDQRIGGYARTWFAGSQPVRVGSRPQGPVGQVSRGLGAARPVLSTCDFLPASCGSLAKAWVSAETAASEVGSRDTPPTPPPAPTPL